MKIKILFALLTVNCLRSLCLAQSNYSDSVTITTYYPAPYGVYKNMRLYPSDQPDMTSGANQQGTMYFNRTEETLYLYKNNTARWVPVGAGAYWELSNDNLTTSKTVEVKGKIYATEDICLTSGVCLSQCKDGGSQSFTCVLCNGWALTTCDATCKGIGLKCAHTGRKSDCSSDPDADACHVTCPLWPLYCRCE